MKYIVLLGRLFFSINFILVSLGHFSMQTISYAAAKGVPMASLLVPLSGILTLLGGLSILLGYKAKYGAWLLVILLVPLTLCMHKFWGMPDPIVAHMQQLSFLKNLSLIGASLFIAYFGSGPFSFDNRKEGKRKKSR